MVYLCLRRRCVLCWLEMKSWSSGNFSEKIKEAVSRWHSNGPNVRFESTGRWQSRFGYRHSGCDGIWWLAESRPNSDIRVWNGLEHRSTFVYSSHIQRAFCNAQNKRILNSHPISKRMPCKYDDGPLTGNMQRDPARRKISCCVREIVSGRIDGGRYFQVILMRFFMPPGRPIYALD